MLIPYKLVPSVLGQTERLVLLAAAKSVCLIPAHSPPAVPETLSRTW